jgi:hypothetical protein
LVRISPEGARFLAQLQNVTQRAADVHLVRGQVVHLDEALIEQHKLALDIKHQQALAHIIEGRVQAHVLILKPLLHDRADHAEGQHSYRDAGDRERNRGGRQRQRVDGARRIRDDLHRAHGGEVMRDDRQREQKRRAKLGAEIAAAYRHRHRDGAEQDSKRHGDCDQVQRPSHAAGQFEGEHAEIVHARNAAADDTAADRRAQRVRADSGNPETDGGDGHRRQQRRYGEPDVVGGRHAGLIGQHGDEMGGPDAAAGRDAGGHDPGRARAAA